MLTDFQNSFTAKTDKKTFHHTLNMLLHYRVKCERLEIVWGSVCESAVLLKDQNSPSKYYREWLPLWRFNPDGEISLGRFS